MINMMQDEHSDTKTLIKRITCHRLFQETKKCLDAGRGQSMDLLYVAPCQNIPSQVEFPFSINVQVFTIFLLFSRSGTLTTISTNNSNITSALTLTTTALTCLPQQCDTHKSLISSACAAQ